LAWASSVRTGNCQPSQLRALQPIACSVIARRPEVTCSPRCDDHVVFGRIVKRVSFAAEADQPVGLARHGRDDHRDFVTRGLLAAHDLATRRIRSVPAIEVPPNFITMRAMQSLTILPILQTGALIGTGYDKGKHGCEQKNYHRPK
jgi:hypothetical protein